jgi:hypothetical protein
VNLEVLYVWGRAEGKTHSNNFEVMSLTLGYEPSCRCGSDCAERPCVHLVAFWMHKVQVKPTNELIWQVALTKLELCRTGVLLMSSHALDVDATGNTTLKELQESEARLIRNAALARSVCLERGDAFGSRLDQIRASLPRASDKGTPDAIHKQVVAQSTLLKQSGARSNACTKRKLDSLPRCFVSIPSPEKALGVMSTKLSKKARISSATDKVSCLPLGEARIYKNWSHRRCFGHECVNEIAMGEWFVNMPVMNQVPSTGHTEHQNIGFCLRTEGQCLATPAAHIASLMRRCGYRFPTSLPIHVRGRQKVDESDVCFLAMHLPGRGRPYISEV